MLGVRLHLLLGGSGRILQRRYYSRMINYMYLAELPFYRTIRKDWAVEGLTAVRQNLDEVLTGGYSVLVMKAKNIALVRHLEIIDDIADLLDNVIYNDSSKKRGSPACANTFYKRGMTQVPISIRTLDNWSIGECKRFAMKHTLASLGDEWFSNCIGLFSDCVPALHQQNVKTTPGPPRGVMVPLVLLLHPDPPWSTFSVNFEKVWIRADQSGPRGTQPPLVDQEDSGPPWTTLPHFSDILCIRNMEHTGCLTGFWDRLILI